MSREAVGDVGEQRRLRARVHVERERDAQLLHVDAEWHRGKHDDARPTLPGQSRRLDRHGPRLERVRAERQVEVVRLGRAPRKDGDLEADAPELAERRFFQHVGATGHGRSLGFRIRSGVSRCRQCGGAPRCARTAVDPPSGSARNGRSRGPLASFRSWRGGRAAQCTGLENRSPQGRVGSNPTPSVSRTARSAILPALGTRPSNPRRSSLKIATWFEPSGRRRPSAKRPTRQPARRARIAEGDRCSIPPPPLFDPRFEPSGRRGSSAKRPTRPTRETSEDRRRRPQLHPT